MAKIKRGAKAKTVRRELLNEMLRLSTNGFGLVAALAWKEYFASDLRGCCYHPGGGSDL